MPVDGFHGYGTILKVGDGASPEVFTAIAALTRIKIPGQETNAIDVSHLTTADSRRRMIPGMITLGKCSFSGLYIPGNTTHAGLKTRQQAGTISNYQIVLSDEADSVVEFEAFVSKFEPGEAALDAMVPFEGELTLTGDSLTVP